METVGRHVLRLPAIAKKKSGKEGGFGSCRGNGLPGNLEVTVFRRELLCSVKSMRKCIYERHQQCRVERRSQGKRLVVHGRWVSSLRSSILLGIFPCCAVVERTVFLLVANLRSLKFGDYSLHTLLRPLQIFLDFLRR